MIPIQTFADIQARITFDAEGLLPCIVQSISGEVRMLGYMNRDAVTQTLATGLVTFFSRKRKTIWVKGESSGNSLTLQSLHIDCDGDTLLAIADCAGPTCHTGAVTCFTPQPVRRPGETLFLGELEQLLIAKKASAQPAGSYTEKLFAAGTDRIAKKVVEEAGEVILAAKTLDHAAPGDARSKSRTELVGEAADLLFHLTLLLTHEQIAFSEVDAVLKTRHQARGAR
jgi:phosphoribosyl-AMP cyclohydrolase / phosphoribosyl-ATP pyrophosphohydrolase